MNGAALGLDFGDDAETQTELTAADPPGARTRKATKATADLAASGNRQVQRNALIVAAPLAGRGSPDFAAGKLPVGEDRLGSVEIASKTAPIMQP